MKVTCCPSVRNLVYALSILFAALIIYYSIFDPSIECCPTLPKIKGCDKINGVPAVAVVKKNGLGNYEERCAIVVPNGTGQDLLIYYDDSNSPSSTQVNYPDFPCPDPYDIYLAYDKYPFCLDSTSKVQSNIITKAISLDCKVRNPKAIRCCANNKYQQNCLPNDGPALVRQYLDFFDPQTPGNQNTVLNDISSVQFNPPNVDVYLNSPFSTSFFFLTPCKNRSANYYLIENKSGYCANGPNSDDSPIELTLDGQAYCSSF